VALRVRTRLSVTLLAYAFHWWHGMMGRRLCDTNALWMAGKQFLQRHEKSVPFLAEKVCLVLELAI
jgi:hypothetical protein